MKKRRKLLLYLLFIAIIVLLIGYFSLYLYINKEGKNILKNKLSNYLNYPVEIEKLSFKFPFRVQLEKLTTKDLQLDFLLLSLRWYNFFNNSLYIVNLKVDGLKYKLNLKRDTSKEPSKSTQSTKSPYDSKSRGKGFRVFINRIDISNSSLQIVQDNKTLYFKDINAHVRDFSYPLGKRFSINLSSNLWQDNLISSLINLQGWVDFPKKDMDVGVDIKDVDSKIFSYFDFPFTEHLKKYGSVKFSLNSRLISKNDNLTITNKLSIDEISPMNNMQDRPVLNILDNLLKRTPSPYNLEVVIKTHMSDIFSKLHLD